MKSTLSGLCFDLLPPSVNPLLLPLTVGGLCHRLNNPAGARGLLSGEYPEAFGTCSQPQGIHLLFIHLFYQLFYLLFFSFLSSLGQLLA